MVNAFVELGSKGYFSTTKGDKNMLIDIIVGGYAGAGVAEIKDASSAAKTVADTWSGSAYLAIKELAWNRLQDYYKTINK